MNVSAILSALKAERDRLDKAIAALSGIGALRNMNRRGSRRRRQMSAEARRRISLAQKRRWAKQKKAH
jgi:hypothetical protein